MSLRKTPLAIITGGSKGIGHQIVQQLTNQGVYCAIISRTPPSSTSKALDTNLHCHFPCDVSDVEQVSSTMKTIGQTFQKTHNMNMLVNAAGISHDGLLMRFPQQELEQVMKINLMGTIYVCKAALRYFMMTQSSAENPSSIVNIASIIGGSNNVTNAGQTIYAASKAGIVGFSQNLSRELLGRNIRVNCISPGFIETDMTKHLDQDTHQKLQQVKLGKPEDVANLVQFLLSEQSRYINGQNIVIDGGLSLL